MTTLRSRRAHWGSLGLSLCVHAAALGALALALDAQPSGPGPERAGNGLLFVALVDTESVGSEALPTSAASEPPLPRSERAHLQPSALEPRARAVSPTTTPAAPPAPLDRAPRPAVETPRSLETTGAVDPPVPPQPIVPDPTPPDAPLAAASTGPGVRALAADGAGAVSNAAPPAGAHANAPLSRVARPASEIRPRYPDAARERGDEGEVIVEAWVAASGRVEHARVRSSVGPEFGVAALEAVRSARFHPAWRDGAAVDSRVALRLHFELER